MVDITKITFKDLSPWVQFAIVWTFIQFGVSCLMLLIYAIIGISLVR